MCLWTPAVTCSVTFYFIMKGILCCLVFLHLGFPREIRGSVSEYSGVRAWATGLGHSPLFLHKDSPQGLAEQQCQGRDW